MPSRPIITEVTDEAPIQQRTGAAAGAQPAMPMPGLGGMDQAAHMRQMAQMLRGNPAMLGMMEGMMANLSQEQLDSMVRCCCIRRSSSCFPSMFQQLMLLHRRSGINRFATALTCLYDVVASTSFDGKAICTGHSQTTSSKVPGHDGSERDRVKACSIVATLSHRQR